MNSEIASIISDIKAIKIQGATNVALATVKCMHLWLEQYKESAYKDKRSFIEELRVFGEEVAKARPNEPLAKNLVKFVTYEMIVRFTDSITFSQVVANAEELFTEYGEMIESTKKSILKGGVEVLKDCNEILTHCHSSTAVGVLVGVKGARSGDLTVISTETRPRFQGRITSQKLLDQGVKTIMIVDSTAPSFIIQEKYIPVDAVIIGVDQVNADGSAINKVGSMGLALAASSAGKPVYVVGPLLKVDVSTVYTPIEVELRSAKEIWDEAPEGLKLINPAFEVIPADLITAYITEFGVVAPSEVYQKAVDEYGWIL